MQVQLSYQSERVIFEVPEQIAYLYSKKLYAKSDVIRECKKIYAEQLSVAMYDVSTKEIKGKII